LDFFTGLLIVALRLEDRLGWFCFAGELERDRKHPRRAAGASSGPSDIVLHSRTGSHDGAGSALALKAAAPLDDQPHWQLRFPGYWPWQVARHAKLPKVTGH
jgi:hypothetical protein